MSKLIDLTGLAHLYSKVKTYVTNAISSHDSSTSAHSTLLSGYSKTDHTHNYAGSDTPGGAATKALALEGLTASVESLNNVAGVTEDIQGQLDGKAPTAHNHSASDITSGTLPVARGGTGASDAATARTNLGITLANIGAAASSHTHNYAGSSSAGGAAKTSNSLAPITTAGTGDAYTATVDGITALTVGASFIMVPNVVSTSTAPTLNVNSLGAKTIRRRVSNSTATTVAGAAASWLTANKPILVTYDGTYWVADIPRPNAADIYGTVPIASGGTGCVSIADTTYTTARYRASSLHSADTTPDTNGVIAWTYE